MKPRTILYFLFCNIAIFFFFQPAIAQKKFVASRANPAAASQLRSQFARYSLFQINTREIAGYAREQQSGKIDFELSLPGLADWKLSIAEHDILSKDYKLVVNSPQGKIIMPRPACMTYAGYLGDAGRSKVRLTIDNDLIYGIINNGDKEYFIEPLRYFDKQAAPDLFVVYDTKDVTPDPNLTCGVVETSQRGRGTQRLMAGTNCLQVQLAIASDESMFLRYGSAAAVQAHNIGVMNNVLWDYVNAQFTDNIEFVIVTQNISTSAASDQLSPAYAGTNSNTVLDNFTPWGESGNFGATYDIGQFWTTRNIDNDGAGGGAGTIGLAWVGAVCTAAKYHILEDFAGSNPSGSGYQLRTLTSHEIGHNFDCNHDAAGSGFIMAPSVNNTNTWSPASITSVNSFIPFLGCLSNCVTAGTPISDFISSSDGVCVGTTIQLTDHSLRGPTSWSWTMTGGSPASSTARNPTVSFATSGIKVISLTSTNGAGTGTTYTKNILVVNSAATACSNTGASASDAGLKSFSLNTINKISGGASTDGNKYMDFSCTDATNLTANTNYTVTVNVGTFTPSNQANLVQFFIDYNNDGDFADANEAVHSSPMCYIGNYSFSFTTLASPPVTNQFLRARVLAKDCVGGVNSCYNVTNGQVEDYSVFFASGVTLPVVLTDFSGYHHNGNNILNWQTDGEKDNSYFEIERSIDGTTFETIGRKEGALNANTATRYSFVDPLTNGFASHHRLYYRLKTVDITGSAEYSKIITISTKAGRGNWLLSLQPNPFTSSITATIHIKDAGAVHMQLFDLAGRTIYQERKNLPAGIHTVAYDRLEQLAKGTYVIKLTSDTETVSRLVEKQ